MFRFIFVSESSVLELKENWRNIVKNIQPKSKIKLKFLNITTITALLFSGISVTNLNAEDKIYTENGYLTKEEIKDVNQLDSVSHAPLNVNYIEYGYGGDLLQPNVASSNIQGSSSSSTSSSGSGSGSNGSGQQTVFLKQGFVFPNHTKPNGTIGDDVIHIYGTATSNTSISSISNNVIMSGVVPFVDATADRYRIVISGADGWVEKKFFRETDLKDTQAYNYYYRNTIGNLVHNIAYQSICTSACNYGVIDNGPAPAYIVDGKKYVSFDGHYFYTLETIPLMLQDYFNGVRSNAINAKDPFYNYYQFLPYRAMTNYTADTLEKYLEYKGFKEYANTNDYNVVTANSKLSKLKDQSKSFFGYGSDFTLNPILTFGIAVNESAWGRSAISVRKNNIFGHGAVDASPDDAFLFESVDQSIYEIYTPTFNWGYVDSDPTVYTNYNGAYLGDKAGGFNVKYASDPYWGQKAARTYYEIDRLYGNLDYQKSTVGITKAKGEIKVYLEPKLNAQYRYPRGSSGNVNLTYRNSSSVLILEEVQGENINNSTLWYKVRSDFMMAKDRTPQTTLPDKAHRRLPYLEDTSYYYIHSSDLTVISKGTVIVTPHPDDKPPVPTYTLGDINNDGKISTADIVKVQRHLINIEKLVGDQFKAADIDGNGKVSTADFVKIQRHLLNIEKIN